jgi:hypothetical protein
MQAKVLAEDEARGVAVNIARLPALLRHGNNLPPASPRGAPNRD